MRLIDLWSNEARRGAADRYLHPERYDGASAPVDGEALIDEWDVPSSNPFYRGKTPREVARLLFEPRLNKVKERE